MYLTNSLPVLCITASPVVLGTCLHRNTPPGGSHKGRTQTDVQVKVPCAASLLRKVKMTGSDLLVSQKYYYYDNNMKEIFDLGF